MGQTELLENQNRSVGNMEDIHAPAPSENSDVRLIWKLKGTGKKARRQVIEQCIKGQPVFIICDSNGENCTVITEEGEEIGRLNEKDSKTYHHYVEKFRYNVYIKRIRTDLEKPRVKILLIVHEKQSHIPDIL
ncbi:MAG: hypothetical protein Q4P20_03295 [Eubacteriales bacterium]|nr:hypothetical protein [Eubacteriales bacterium]